MLSGGTPRELLAAVAAGDTARLQSVPGIGKRTAERIVVELREKVGSAPADRPDRRSPAATTRGCWPATGSSASATPPRRPSSCSTGAEGDTTEALIAHALKVAPAMIRTPGVDRVQTPHERVEDELDATLRPQRLDEFVGQEALKEQLAVSIAAASARNDALDHVLLAGPPGLGKTSLARIVAEELGVPFVQTAGPALERKGDIASYLTDLEPRTVFFVDEIHRLPRAVEETFYPAMEDRQLPITLGVGPGAKVVTLDLPPFTLIGATTRAGLLTTPLRDRFGIQHRLEHYAPGELTRIVVALRRRPRRRDRRRRRARDRRPRARHPARRQPPAQARARLRAGPRRRRDRRDGGRRRAATSSASTTRAWTGSTASCSPRSASASPAGPSASRRSPSPSARRPTRSRTSTSRTCCSAASSCARRAAAAPPRTPTAISASSRPPSRPGCSRARV